MNFCLPTRLERLKLDVSGSHFPQHVTEDLTHNRDNKCLDGWRVKDIIMIKGRKGKGLDSELRCNKTKGH